MNPFRTLDLSPPAAIAFFAQGGATIVTNLQSSTSLSEERIRSTFEGAQRELRRYEQYAPCWDGYRAEPFSQDVLGNVASILDYSEGVFLGAGMIPELVTTGPASDGSIDVEIQVGVKRVLMTLYPQEQHLRLSSFDAEGAHESTVPLRTQTLEEWLSWLRHSGAVPRRMGEDPIRP
jgi:hypothetical protein